MNVLEISSDILKEISKIKQENADNNKYISLAGTKSSYNDLNLNFNITKERKWSMRDNSPPHDGMPIPLNSPKSKKFRITYLLSIIQFLDYNSIFNLSLTNKEFHYFFSSIWYYKFISQIKEYQKKTNKNSDKKETSLNNSFSSQGSLFSSKKKGGGFLSALTGALSYFAPVAESGAKKENKIDLKEIKERIELHEKILTGKLQQIQISKEIIDIRNNIDKLIDERFENQKKKDDIIDDREIEKIKRDKLEKTYLELKKEVDSLNNESIKLKNIYENLQKEDIDKELKINLIGNYIKNNFTNQNSPIK